MLGVVQGLTEFLPVSSSGHLVLFQHLFGLVEPELLFDVCVHVGTLAA
ncbi:MAG: undecaprenyl-diphosphate phosphatase, partial [Desulfobacteraceae bacterium]